MTDRAWDAPSVEQVLDGVFRIPLPLPNDGLKAVNVYAIVDGDGLVLVDSGWAIAESQAQLERSLAEIGYKLADIHQFLVTHAHADHYAQAIAVRRILGTHVQIGIGERPTLELLSGPDHNPYSEVVIRLEQAGARDLIAAVRAMHAAQSDTQYFDFWELPDGWLTSGDRVTLTSRTLEVVETPGHTTGHVVYHDAASAVLFSGDHVLPTITPSIGLEPQRQNLPLTDYLESLRLLHTLPDALLLPAHGPVAPSVHLRVDELLAHHERRLTLSAAAIDTGASTVYEVAKLLLWTRRDKRFIELDLFNQTLAIGETKVHLDVCVARGWLRSTIDPDQVLHYERA